MKFVDDSQNLRVRLRLIQVLVLVLLGVLCVRLYLLQIVNGAHYAEIAENQRIRLLPIPAPRGVIFDRNGTIAGRFAADLQRDSLARSHQEH